MHGVQGGQSSRGTARSSTREAAARMGHQNFELLARMTSTGARQDSACTQKHRSMCAEAANQVAGSHKPPTFNPHLCFCQLLLAQLHVTRELSHGQTQRLQPLAKVGGDLGSQGLHHIQTDGRQAGRQLSNSAQLNLQAPHLPQHQR